MKATELRIGNLVDRFIDSEDIWENHVQCELSDIDAMIKKEEEGIDIGSYVEPIRLTEKWLTRLGFEKGLINHPVHGECESWHIAPPPNSFCEHFALCDMRLWSNGYLSNDIEFVHELQNLYFALTGTELELK